jgi:hypothetical protein
MLLVESVNLVATILEVTNYLAIQSLACRSEKEADEHTVLDLSVLKWTRTTSAHNMLVTILVITLALCMYSGCDGFATYMTRKYCSTPMVPGTVMMDQVSQESDLKAVKVFLNDIELFNGTTLTVFENVTVKIEPKHYQMVLECSIGVSFESGKCDGGRRTNTNGAKLLINADAIHTPMDIRIIGAWANGYMEGVRFTKPIFLHYEPAAAVAVEQSSTDDSQQAEL